MRYLRPLLTAALAIPFSSCGLSPYSRDFQQATTTLARPASDVDGPWIGTWKSQVNGHQGPLWCIVHPAPNQPGRYDFRYRAGWGTLQFGDYTHTLSARTARDGSLPLAGEMVLPGGLGIYQVKGRLTRESFTATYQSKADRGTMTLSRPAAL
ncbi:MAG: hypothetical protein WCH40_09295 [Verrucomicrobiales bacterium]